MKLNYLVTATAAVALLGGAAYAQQPQPQKGPTPGSVTGDWNGAHSPPDDKQYQEKVQVPLGSTPPAEETAPPPADTSASTSTSTTSSVDTSTTASTDVTTPAAPAASTTATNASFTNTTVTNGPVPDTKENRAKYGQPLSRAGRMTAARGN